MAPHYSVMEVLMHWTVKELFFHVRWWHLIIIWSTDVTKSVLIKSRLKNTVFQELLQDPNIKNKHNFNTFTYWDVCKMWSHRWHTCWKCMLCQKDKQVYMSIFADHSSLQISQRTALNVVAFPVVSSSSPPMLCYAFYSFLVRPHCCYLQVWNMNSQSSIWNDISSARV